MITDYEGDIEGREQQLREAIHHIRVECEERAKPYIDELVRLYSLRSPQATLIDASALPHGEFACKAVDIQDDGITR